MVANEVVEQVRDLYYPGTVVIGSGIPNEKPKNKSRMLI